MRSYRSCFATKRIFSSVLNIQARSSGPSIHSVFKDNGQRSRYLSSSENGDKNLNDDRKLIANKSENGFSEILPGLAASFIVCGAGFQVADLLGSALMAAQGISSVGSVISGIPVSILLGIGFRHFSGDNTLVIKNQLYSLDKGAAFASKRVLQLGIICVGLKLSFVDLLTTGAYTLPAVMLSVGTGLVVVPLLGQKVFNLPQKMSYLTAIGTSICGVTAITALAPSINASKRDTSFAVANVVAFGTFGMLIYPYFAHYLFTEVCANNPDPTAISRGVGLFLGLGIHDTSQVIGSALTYNNIFDDEQVLKVATVTKLSRNILLAFAIPYLTLMSQNGEKQATSVVNHNKSDSDLLNRLSETAGRLYKYTPGFVYGFVAMCILRTAGDVYLPEMLTEHSFQIYNSTVKFLGNDFGSKILLGTAMAGVGLTTSLKSLEGVGYTPFLLGLSGALVVGGTGLASALLWTQIT